MFRKKFIEWLFQLPINEKKDIVLYLLERNDLDLIVSRETILNCDNDKFNNFFNSYLDFLRSDN